MIKKLPLPVAGLMLALAATGNLLLSYGQVYRHIFAILAFALFLLLFTKILLQPKSVADGLQNPLLASVMPTFTMGIILLSAYLNGHIPQIAYFTWILGIFLHIALIAAYTVNHILKFNWQNIYPSCFIVYVGIACASVTAPAFGMAHVGRMLFWFAFISFFVLLPVVLYRTLFVNEIPATAMPTFAVYTAPANLCLAGYLNSFATKNLLMVGLLSGISLLLLVGVLIHMPRLLKTPFSPAYSCFTFPFVITAIAIKAASSFLGLHGISVSFIKPFIHLLELWAVTMVVYVFIRYIIFMLANPETTAPAVYAN